MDGKVYALRWSGSALIDLSGWEGGILLHSSAYAVQSSPAVADVAAGTLDTTGKPEIVVGCDDGFLYSLFANGRNHVDSSGTSTGAMAVIWSCRPDGDNSSKVLSSPTVDDIDGDGSADIIVGSEAGIWRFEMPVTFDGSAARYPWPTFHHDAARTGCTTPPPPCKYGSMVGKVTQGGQPMIGAQVYIYFQDGSQVPKPKTSPVQYRGPVRTVGNLSLPVEINRGGYSINQLQPSDTFQPPRNYRLKVVYGAITRWVKNITGPAGKVTVNVAL